MGTRVRGRMLGMMVLALLMISMGCAGSGKAVNLSVKAIPSADAGMKSADQSSQLRVVVRPFEDVRSNRDHLGVRTHLGGGVTTYNLAGGEPGKVVADVIAEYLSERGWSASVGTSDGQPDVVLTGNLLDLSVHAKSRVGSTFLRTTLKLALRAVNSADQSATTMSLEDSREDTVFWFDPEDLENLMNQMLEESVRNMVASVRVTDGILRMQ